MNVAKGVGVIIVLIWGYYLVSGSAKRTGLDKKLEELVPGENETKPEETKSDSTKTPKVPEKGSLDDL